MAKRRKSVDVRLGKAIEARIDPKYLWRRKNHPFGITGNPPNLDKSEVWAIYARSALTLGPEDKKLKIAFETLRLDPSDPRRWRELLDVLVEVQSPVVRLERKRRGRKPKWTLKQLTELVEAIYRIQRDSPKRLTDPRACKELVRLAKLTDGPSYLRETTLGALVRQVVSGRKKLRQRAINRGEQPPVFLIRRKN